MSSKKMVHIIISKFRPKKKRPSSFPLTSPIHTFFPPNGPTQINQGLKAPLNMPTCLEQSKRELPESQAQVKAPRDPQLVGQLVGNREPLGKMPEAYSLRYTLEN